MSAFVKPSRISLAVVLASACLLHAQDLPLPLGTQPLTVQGDLSAQMVAGIETFLLKETERSIADRQTLWTRDFSSAEAYDKSVEANRFHLRKIIGAGDPRVAFTALELIGSSADPAKIAETNLFTLKSVRWPVFDGVFAEGLWLLPKTAPVSHVVVIPDADQTPEMLAGLAPGLATERQFARRLAENGCEVLVPVLIDRQDTGSGTKRLNRFTNQPHREWIYRQAYEMGRHIIGYEVEKVLAAVDWFSRDPTNSSGVAKGAAGRPHIGLAGYCEGGLIALYAAALDSRIDATLVSGYFDSRQKVWQEPIYRNVFGLLSEFGDAEIATLVAPRTLVVEHSEIPKIDGPPKRREGRGGAAPGQLKTPDYESVEREVERARSLLKAGDPKVFGRIDLISGNEGMATGPASDRALIALLTGLGVNSGQLKKPGTVPVETRTNFDPADRQQRQMRELETYTQTLCRESESRRADFFWSKVKAGSPQEWQAACTPFRSNFWSEVIGKFPSPTLPANARSRPLTPAAKADSAPKKWTGHEVVLDVFPDVFAWGYLLVPNDLKPGERRPVVVCQHGLEGVPADVINEDSGTQAFGYYKAFAARLAEQGFIVFAPHNPYRGEDKFRRLQREANPIKKSLFSVIIAQHEQILNWLSGLPFVDPQRIGFYGLSYGGKTAMRVPAVLDRYVLSVCSGDFNDWIRKNVSVDSPLCYLFGGEYEMPEFDLGLTFNYAEMAALIAPRPFMIERGHSDGVGIDEWVAYEYAKVRRLYDQLNIGDRTTIEYFNGPHTINGKGTFDFLHQYLNWPKQ